MSVTPQRTQTVAPRRTQTSRWGEPPISVTGVDLSKPCVLSTSADTSTSSVASRSDRPPMRRQILRLPTATFEYYPMWLLGVHRFIALFSGDRIMDSHQALRRQGELVEWETLPADAIVIFVSHEWAG